MAYLLRNAKVPPNSASVEEAKHRVFDFFKEACRSLPAVMDIYNLYDVVTISELRASISSQIRKNSKITDPKGLAHLVKPSAHTSCDLGSIPRSLLLVIDMLLFKGREELKNVVEHSKQRHHIIGQYVIGRRKHVQDLSAKDQGISPFLKSFYESNYF